jgi:hypothetical protein
VTLNSSNDNDIYSIFHFRGINIIVHFFGYIKYLELRRENEEKELDVYSYVQIIKDALHLNRSVCLARNFSLLQKEDIDTNKRKVFVDIWPVCLLILTLFEKI